MVNIKDWNKKLYQYPDDKEVEKSMGADEFWDKFNIKSSPKFRDACWYYVPGVWADDVCEFISAVQEELGDRIEFVQIKEKFCCFNAYVKSKDEGATKRFDELKKECVDKLIAKGVHPSQ